MNIFVGDLSPDITEQDLRSIFASFGQVEVITVIDDSNSPTSRLWHKKHHSNPKSWGYAYVNMPNRTEALAAIVGVNGRRVKGLPVRVLEALPMERSASKER